MDLRQHARAAPYYLATAMEETGLWQFWVVLLDNGLQIFQTADSVNLDEPNSWVRLKQFCKDNGCKILAMAFAQQNLDPNVQINLKEQADGYFYSRRIRKLMSRHPGWSGYADEAQGVGVLQGDVLTIHWVDKHSGRVTVENRDITKHHKNDGGLGLIRS